MDNKTDTYRIYKILDAIRKGFYWQNIDSIDRSKQSEYLRRHMNNVRELEDTSNTSLSLTIFATSILISVLQLIQSIFDALEARLSILLISLYIFSLIVIYSYNLIKKKKITNNMRLLEEEVANKLDNDLSELKKSDLTDSIQIHLTELSLLDEIGEETVENFKDGKLGDTELEHILKLIVNKADAVKYRIDQKREMLSKLKGNTARM